MKFYVGNPGKITQIAVMREKGYGAMLSDYRSPGRYPSYAIDNGAYGAWRRGEEWDAEAFREMISKFWKSYKSPDFVVVPDIVGDGESSIRRSVYWLPQMPPHWCDYYLAVQDGMTTAMVKEVLGAFDGIFVGGTVQWKWETVQSWVDLAHDSWITCHVGRVGTIRNIRRAAEMGVDSVDSSSWARNDTLRYIEEAMS